VLTNQNSSARGCSVLDFAGGQRKCLPETCHGREIGWFPIDKICMDLLQYKYLAVGSVSASHACQLRIVRDVEKMWRAQSGAARG